MAIEFKNVSQVFMQGSQQEARALNNISLTIEDGLFIGIIGHTGSGKSTFVQHINALMMPTTGTVIVDGIDTVNKKMRRELRKNVGMVFQYPEYQLFDETVAKDIAFGPINFGYNEIETDEAVRSSMQLVGLDYSIFAEKSPFELSGGEKRRVAIAGTIATKPKVLILDEPMAGLDPLGRRDMLLMLEEYNKRGNTVIMISHSMDDVASVCSRIIVFNDGNVEQYDEPVAVFSDREKLMAIGLDMPTSQILTEALRKYGVDIRNAMNLEEVREKVLRRWRNEQ